MKSRTFTPTISPPVIARTCMRGFTCIRVDMVVLPRHWRSICPYRRANLSHKTLQRNAPWSTHTQTEFIIIARVSLHMRTHSEVATKFRTTKINSDSHLQDSTKICTHENNPLYGSLMDLCPIGRGAEPCHFHIAFLFSMLRKCFII